MHLLAPLNISTDFDAADLGLPIEPDAKASARQWYEQAGRPEVAVYPGTSRHQARYHRWPAEKWIALLKRLDARGVRAAVFWGPDDAEYAAAIAKDAGGGCILAPKTTLPEMMATLGRFPAFIGTNTAAMHMAWMQGVPTAVFTGPAEPRTDAPLAPVPFRVLRAGAAVRAGVSKRHQPEVVAAVPVEEAVDAVLGLLEESWLHKPKPSSAS